MTGAWSTVYLHDVADEITVGHVGSMADQYVDAGIPFLRSLNVEPFRINTKDLKYISNEFHARLKKSTLKPGDLVIVRTGKPGACAIIPDWLVDANCSDVVLVKAGPRVRAGYILYVVNSTAVHHIASFTVGAVQQHFNVGAARQIQFRLPPLDEQDRILRILGALDDKIELNRRMNETLEAMMRAIFKDWFVDFGPTRAKLDGRAPYLAPDIWSLFPDRLDDAGKPKGWVESEIGKEVEVIGGSTPSTEQNVYWTNGEYHWATPKDLSKLASPVLLDTERKITSAGVSVISSGLLSAGTVLLSSRAPIGYLAIAEVPTAINQGFIAMRCSGAISNLFALLWTQANMEAIHAKANGSTFQEISKSSFRPIPLIRPSNPLLAAFETTCRPLYNRLVANVRENQTLTTLRDLILPKLMSGEIRVQDVERIVGAAT